jgi:hypothetical protein
MKIGSHRSITANEHITIGSNSYEKIEFKYLGFMKNKNPIHDEIKCIIKAGNSYCFSV